MKWTTKEGKKIEVRDMETSHIKNCLNKMLKEAKVISKEYCDTGYQGDSYINDCVKVERKATEDDLMQLSPIYKEMKLELKKRNL